MEKEYFKDFDDWNIQKKLIEDISANLICKERDIWWCSIGCNIGSEIDGKNEYFERPVIIFRKFGEDLAWVIPLTSRDPIPNSRFEFPIIVNNLKQVVEIDQMRPISNKRLLRYLSEVSYNDFQEIRKIFLSLG